VNRRKQRFLLICRLPLAPILAENRITPRFVMHISYSNTVLLVVAGLLAGVMNAVAGGGTFLTFPALVFIGIPSVPANQTSTIAVFPGQCASFWAYRKILAAQTRTVVVLGVTSLLGGAMGATILLHLANALKVILTTAFNTLAVVIFLAVGKIYWTAAFILGAATIVGGYGGAWIAQKLPPAWVRGFVMVVGAAMTAYFFLRIRYEK
jgi:uncharacterized membrane protein YfcA